MNLLNLVSHTLGGLLAGYASWLCMRGSVPWGFREHFLGTLMTTGVFSALLLGLCQALLSLGNELRYQKAMRLFSSHSAAGLAIPMMGTVVYSLFFDISGVNRYMPELVARGLWWVTLALAIALARGITFGNPRSGGVAFLGLAPGLLISGLLMDRFFLPRDMWLAGALVMGGTAGGGLGMALEMLKEAWLEVADTSRMSAQYILETEEFTAGSGEHCDMTIRGGPQHRFVILEEDGLHHLEVIAGEPLTIGGTSRFRYRVLLEGDTIQIDDTVWVYHTRVVRTRDAVPQAAV